MFSDDISFLNNVRKYVGSRLPSGLSYSGSGFYNIGAMLYNLVPPEVRTAIPGMNVVQNISDTQRYWADYKKNTGKSPRYPGVQIHSRDIGDAVDTARSMDWWLR